MFYEFIVNQKTNSLYKDSSYNELHDFISTHKTFILEKVYEYLNVEKEDHPYQKGYERFLYFIQYVKEQKEREEFIFHFQEPNNVDETIWDISQDIIHLKKCSVQKKESKTKTIQKIFQLEK